MSDNQPNLAGPSRASSSKAKNPPQNCQQPIPSTSKGFRSSLKVVTKVSKKTKQTNTKQNVDKNPLPPPTRIPNPDEDSGSDPESSKPYDYSPVLSQVLNEKKLVSCKNKSDFVFNHVILLVIILTAIPLIIYLMLQVLMESPDVAKFLNDLQGHHN